MIIHFPFQNKTVDLFRPERVSSDTPLVLLLTGGEDPAAIWEKARRMTERDFCLAALPVTDWERELSPWRAEKVFRGGRDFGDGADETIRELEHEIMPELKRTPGFRDMPCVIAGYSLAGLFAVYALYRTDVFSGAVSASGSLWFPGFLDYAASHAMPRTPGRVYLSLGDREKNTKSPVMRRVEENTAALHEKFCAGGVECIFELNPGSHFQDVEHRIAKGIARIVSAPVERQRLPDFGVTPGA